MLVKMKNPMNSESINSWVGVGTALGAAVFAVTKDPVWVGVGVAVGAALGWRGFKGRQKSD